MSNEQTDVRGIILAAGFGTRLAPVTDHLPKPMLPVGGEPLLDKIITKLRLAGINQIAVNSHHRGEILAAHLAQHPYTDQLVHFPEPDILGTGGALDNARSFLAEAPVFLVYNGDVLCGVDLAGLLAAHRDRGALATLLLADWPAVNSVTVASDGAIRHIGGMGDRPPSAAGDRHLTYTGIGVFDRRLLADIGPGFSSLIDPLARALAQECGSVRGYAPPNLVWDDLGTLGRWLASADEDAHTSAGFQLQRITGHGSDRRFWRLGFGDWSAVAMVSPPQDEEFDRFVAVGNFLAAADLGPAAFLAIDEPGRTVLMEDLGAKSLWAVATAKDTPAAELLDYYRRVVDHLLALQAATARAQTECPLAVDRTLDLDQLRWETTYFRERFLQGHLKLTASELSGLDSEFASLAATVAEAPVALMHRDFQSQNILMQDLRVRLVDYQGLRLGPVAYDLASLVWDPYVALPMATRRELLTRFAKGCPSGHGDDVRAMTVAAGLQRVMQALGAFGFLGHVKGKTDFLAHIPAAVSNLRLLLGELADLPSGTRHAPPPMPQLTALMDNLTLPDRETESRA